MGWPRENEVGRIYRDKDGSYCIVWPKTRNGRGCMDALANAFEGSRPTLCGVTVHPDYLASGGLRRVSWSDLPAVWQQNFRGWLTVPPETIRGFWHTEEQPQHRTVTNAG